MDGREVVYFKDQRRGYKGVLYDYEDIDIGDVRYVVRNLIIFDVVYYSYS